jgi:hypothetical protein
MESLKKGDKVYWSGAWNTEPYEIVTVNQIEEVLHEGEKWGFVVEEMEWSKMKNCVVLLNNGKWAYGYQIKPLSTPPEELIPLPKE